MGRTVKDRHDLDDNDIDLDDDEFDVTDEDLERLINSMQQIQVHTKKVKKKRHRKIVPRHQNFPTNINDWRDPEDDIMYGFEE